MKRIFTLLADFKTPALMAAFLLLMLTSYSQTNYSWRNDQNPTSGQWNVANYWWNGSAGVLPGGGEILFLNGDKGLTMTNDLPSTNRHKITFGSGGEARTINGSTENTFFESSTTWPWINNSSSNTQTINFPIKASSTSGFNLELIASTAALVVSNTVNNNGRTIQIYGNNSSVDGANRFVRLSGIVSGSGILNVSQSGVCKLNAAHTYTGETQVDNGELWIESTGSIASGSGIFVGNGTQLTNRTPLWLSNATGGATFANNITINPGDYQKRYLGGLNTSGTHTFSGNITNNAGNLSLSAVSAGGTTQFTNIISGAGQVNIEGAGTTILSGTNTYTGLTYINAGNLRLNKTGGTTLPNTNNITVDNGGSLRVMTNQTLNSLSLLNNSSVTVDDGVILTINGILTLTSGKITLGTTGTGSVVVSATGSISGGSSASYVVTNGIGIDAGGLTQQTANNTAKLFPVGATGSSYDPVTITPMTGVNFTVYVKSALTNPIKAGATAAFAVQREWNITATGQGATTLAFTPHTSAVNAGNTPSGSAGAAGHWNGSAWDANIATTYAAGTWTIAGYTGAFSPFIVAAPGVVLAAELTSFKGSTAKGQNILDWKTASEKNAAHFDIQRSSDNTAWSSIGQVKAVNNAYGADYQFFDAQPLSGTNYYRLQMVDANGSTELSKIVAVNASNGNKSLKVYPNPAKDVLTILTDANTEGVSIFDINGRLVLSVVDKSQNVNIQKLASGVYFVRMMDKTGFVGSPVRFVKQ